MHQRHERPGVWSYPNSGKVVAATDEYTVMRGGTLKSPFDLRLPVLIGSEILQHKDGWSCVIENVMHCLLCLLTPTPWADIIRGYR